MSLRVCPCVSLRVHGGAACAALQRAGCAVCGAGVCGVRGGPGPTCCAEGEEPPPLRLRAELASFSPVFAVGTAGGKCQQKRCTEMCL